jgi:hypothetical protein
MATAELPRNIKSDVIEFVRLDDGLKKAREEMKGARKALEEYREKIIVFMRESEALRLDIKKGTQFLELKEKELKVRPSAECVKDKIKELMQKGITDPEVFYEEINKCGGTKQVWKLARRTKRTVRSKTAAPSSSATATAADEEPKKKKQRKVVGVKTTESGV